jgi:hypothetical protein
MAKDVAVCAILFGLITNSFVIYILKILKRLSLVYKPKFYDAGYISNIFLLLNCYFKVLIIV